MKDKSNVGCYITHMVLEVATDSRHTLLKKLTKVVSNSYCSKTCRTLLTAAYKPWAYIHFGKGF